MDSKKDKKSRWLDSIGKCSECGSTNLTYYDDGEGYPPNINCEDCGNWD